MDTKAAIIALLSVWGVGTCVTLPVAAQDTTESADEQPDRSNPRSTRSGCVRMPMETGPARCRSFSLTVHW